MKKITLVVIAFIAAVLIQSCNKIKGEGPVVSKIYQLSGFTAIDAGIDADVYYMHDSFYKVEIQAQQNIQNIIQTSIISGTLVLQFEKYKNIGRHDRIMVFITTPELTGLKINGSGSVQVLQPVTTNTLNVEVNGSGSISMAGLTSNMLTSRISGSGNIAINGGAVASESTSISGSGEIDLIGLNAKNATVETSGSGKTRVSVSDHLDIHISGSGDVYYTGHPSIHTEISGSGKVTAL